MSGSASPPDTSLTSTAPASIAAAATAARVVSMLTGTPWRHQVGDHGQHPRRLRGRVDPHRAGPGRLAADVDEVGPRRPQREAVPDGVVVVEEPAAVGERVGRDVEHAQHRAPAEPRQHHVPRISDSASARELGEVWKIPRTAEVVVRAPACGCRASPCTGARPPSRRSRPRGSSLRTIASATWAVSALLDLGPAGVEVDDPRQLRQARHPAALAGDVADVRDAVERHEVVLAAGEDRDVLDEDQLLVVLVERLVQDGVGVGVEAREDLGVGRARPWRGCRAGPRDRGPRRRRSAARGWPPRRGAGRRPSAGPR